MHAMPEGFLVAAGSEGFEGWAWDPRQPYEPVEVELTANGAVLARGIADHFQMELVQSRIGNGMHAFRLKLDRLPDAPYPLIVTARIAGGGPALGGQLEFKSPADFQGIVADAAFRDYESMVDGIVNGQICGWIWNRSLPDAPVTVSLYDGLTHIGDVIADDFRGDVAAAGKGSGRCAFAIDLPLSVLDGALHSLHVRVADTNHELTNSPLGFGPNSARNLIDEIAQLRQEVATLTRQLSEVADPSNALNGRLAKALMQRMEAMLTIQRDAVDQEMRALRTMGVQASVGD
ncbi:hypothetical protein GBZ26_09995 [Azospirillum formosense]|uniref:Uncharacterized protein n=1 Tax=Azospirillum formosense TaxID=861533 RepID=A0ABX2KV69_9PROT|nr:hypothetical protein [Azospirillum formosense]MBY3757673.1 hypothetical protein [Azospirillum formosense]NUB19542.1 hypothetical protein [Azospirillum formosense]